MRGFFSTVAGFTGVRMTAGGLAVVTCAIAAVGSIAPIKASGAVAANKVLYFVITKPFACQRITGGVYEEAGCDRACFPLPNPAR